MNWLRKSTPPPPSPSPVPLPPQTTTTTTTIPTTTTGSPLQSPRRGDSLRNNSRPISTMLPKQPVPVSVPAPALLETERDEEEETKIRQMNFMLYTDVTRASEEVTAAVEQLAKAAENFAYTYETLVGLDPVEDAIPKDNAQNLASLIAVARVISTSNRHLSESLRTDFVAPLKKDYNACSSITQSTIRENENKIAALAQELKILESRNYKAGKKRGRNLAEFQHTLEQMQAIAVEIKRLQVDCERKGDELAARSLPFVVGNTQEALRAVSTHFGDFATNVKNLVGKFKLAPIPKSKV